MANHGRGTRGPPTLNVRGNSPDHSCEDSPKFISDNCQGRGRDKQSPNPTISPRIWARTSSRIRFFATLFVATPKAWSNPKENNNDREVDAILLSTRPGSVDGEPKDALRVG